MWEKISKEMALPWRAAEAMHWQIGEVEMAQRANVPVFHLAGQQNSHSARTSEDRRTSTSPSSVTGAPSHISYSHTHNHSLPQLSQPLPQPISPLQTRLRRNSSASAPGSTSSRNRADSARSVPTSVPRALLPPVSEIAGPRPLGQLHYEPSFIGTTMAEGRR